MLNVTAFSFDLNFCTAYLNNSALKLANLNTSDASFIKIIVRSWDISSGLNSLVLRNIIWLLCLLALWFQLLNKCAALGKHAFEEVKVLISIIKNFKFTISDVELLTIAGLSVVFDSQLIFLFHSRRLIRLLL